MPEAVGENLEDGDRIVDAVQAWVDSQGRAEVCPDDPMSRLFLGGTSNHSLGDVLRRKLQVNEEAIGGGTVYSAQGSG